MLERPGRVGAQSGLGTQPEDGAGPRLCSHTRVPCTQEDRATRVRKPQVCGWPILGTHGLRLQPCRALPAQWGSGLRGYMCSRRRAACRWGPSSGKSRTETPFPTEGESEGRVGCRWNGVPASTVGRVLVPSDPGRAAELSPGIRRLAPRRSALRCGHLLEALGSRAAVCRV